MPIRDRDRANSQVAAYIRRLKRGQDAIKATLRENTGPQRVVDQRSGIDGVAISDSISSSLAGTSGITPSSVAIVDDFEDNNLDEYETISNAPEVTTTASIDGTYGLELPGGLPDKDIFAYSNEGLANYPGQGFTTRWKAKFTDTVCPTTRMSVGRQDNGDAYSFVMDPLGDSVRVATATTGYSGETVFTYNANTVYYGYGIWSLDGICHLVTSKSDSPLGLSGLRDTSYDDGGYGLEYDTDAASSGDDAYIDTVENVYEHTTFEDFSTDVSNFGGDTSNFTTQSSVTLSGQGDALKGDGSTSKEPSISSTDTTLQSGRVYQVRVNFGGSGTGPATWMFTDSEQRLPKGYLMDCNNRSDALNIYYYDGSSLNFLTNTSASFPSGWATKIMGQLNGYTFVGVYDDSGIIGFVRTQDTTRTSGGYGFQVRGSSTDSVYWDTFERVY